LFSYKIHFFKWFLMEETKLFFVIRSAAPSIVLFIYSRLLI